MNDMKINSKALIAGLLAAFVLVVLGVSSASAPKGGETVVLGATLPLSGDLAFLGEGYRNGMNLALRNLGNTKFTYKIVFEDDKFDPATAAGTAEKLVSVDHADGLFSVGSPVGNVVSLLAEKKQIVHINGLASDQNVATGDYNFVHWTPPYEESRVLTAELLKRGIHRAAMFTTNQPGTLAVSNQVKADLKKNGIELVGEEAFNPGEKDMKTHVAKLSGTKPDIYILIAMSPELEILTKQMKEQGITTPLTSIESFEWTSQPDLFEGMWYVNGADPSADFVAEYKAAYGIDPSVGAANAYDAVKLFVAAVEKSANGATRPTEAQIKDALLAVKNFPGAVGTISMDPNGVVVSQAVVRSIKDGKPVTIP